MFKALLIEIKNSIFTSWFHIVRFGGLLLVPLLYGFSYVFAFWDPFKNIDQLPIAIVTEKVSDKNKKSKTYDYFGDALGNVMTKTHKTHIGDLEINIKAEHLYADSNSNGEIDLKNINTNKYHATLVVPNLTPEIDQIIKDAAQQNAKKELSNFASIFSKIIFNKFRIINNFKSNYLIAFGIDLGASMSGTHGLLMSVLTGVLNDSSYKEHIKNDLSLTNTEFANYDNFVTNGLGKFIKLTENNKFSIVKQETQMKEYSKYGYGLAPFFISVAMWVGGMVMTFAIHRKIYDNKIKPATRYFAKWILIVSGIIVQALILMIALYIIGFNKIGFSHWLSMLGFAIYTGIIFATIIQAIRFSITSRNISILISIIILILQMASGGGLFPIQTQSHFYHVLHVLLPMGHSITGFRELVFEPRWEIIVENMGYLLIYPIIFVPLGIILNNYQTKNFYLSMNWDFYKLTNTKLPIKKKYNFKKGQNNV